MRKEVCWGFAVLVLAVGHVAAAGRVETMFVESDDRVCGERVQADRAAFDLDRTKRRVAR
jgi:hypothetical protein